MFVCNLDCQDIKLTITDEDIANPNNNLAQSLSPVSYIIKGYKHNFFKDKAIITEGYTPTEIPDDIWNFLLVKYKRSPVLTKGVIFAEAKRNSAKDKMRDMRNSFYTRALDPLNPSFIKVS